MGLDGTWWKVMPLIGGKRWTGFPGRFSPWFSHEVFVRGFLQIVPWTNPSTKMINPELGIENMGMLKYIPILRVFQSFLTCPYSIYSRMSICPRHFRSDFRGSDQDLKRERAGYPSQSLNQRAFQGPKPLQEVWLFACSGRLVWLHPRGNEVFYPGLRNNICLRMVHRVLILSCTYPGTWQLR